jgi:magnesium chelatase family protein
MLAKRMPTILPPLTFGDAPEARKIHSVPGVLDAITGLIAAPLSLTPHIDGGKERSLSPHHGCNYF